VIPSSSECETTPKLEIIEEEVRMKLEGKSVIITGATSGMGEATARLFAREGARVTIAGRSNAGETVAESIRSKGGNAMFVRTDVSQPTDIKALFDRHMSAYGQLDVLFNNAAYAGSDKLMTETSEADFDLIVSTNYKAVFVACQLAVPIMASARAGSIINTTAASSREGLAWSNLGAYIGSKGAVVAFTRALAVEVAGTGIRANSLSPGLIDTPMLRGSVNQQPDPAACFQAFSQIELLKRMGTGEEIATAALFLASSDSAYITGIDLLVDGGLVLGSSAPTFFASRA
jgi:NAD(P)-dependent dehydrogenase (short-subunit alcohol dehydrogenase family)